MYLVFEIAVTPTTKSAIGDHRRNCNTTKMLVAAQAAAASFMVSPPLCHPPVKCLGGYVANDFAAAQINSLELDASLDNSGKGSSGAAAIRAAAAAGVAAYDVLLRQEDNDPAGADANAASELRVATRMLFCKVPRRHGSAALMLLPPPLGSPLVQQLCRTALGTAIAQKISTDGLKRGSLSPSGSAAAFAVAAVAFSCSFRSGLTLLAFYKSGSALTKVGAKVKAKVEEGYAAEGQRGSRQVLACSLIAVVCALLRRVLVGIDGPLRLSTPAEVACLGNRLTLAFVAFFAACAGDTWASEVGVLSRSAPRLITRPWVVAAPGTNGGVSGLGSLASAAGGVFIGLCHGLIAWPVCARDILALVWVGLLGGVGGSLFDSVLGATVQATYFDATRGMIVKRPAPTAERVAGLPLLSNEMVNFVSTAAVAMGAALAPQLLLGWLVA